MKSTTAPRQDGSRKRRWRNFLINSRFQWKYAGAIMLSMFALSACSSLLLYGMLQDQGATTSGSEWNSTLTVAVFALGSAIAATMALGLYSIILTHRICGPIFVIGRWLDELSVGRFPKRRPLRPKDEFKELYEKFWRAVSALRAARCEELAELSAAADILRKVARDEDDARAAELERVAASIELFCQDQAEALGETRSALLRQAIANRFEPLSSY